MILLKWATPWEGGNGPMLLNVLINMFMSPGSLSEVQLYDGQAGVQLGLLLAAFVSVPFLLLPKPLIGYYEHRRAQRAAGASNYTMMMAADSSAPHNPQPMPPAAAAPAGHGGGGVHGGGGDEDEEEYSFTDEFVHQVSWAAVATARARAQHDELCLRRL